MEKNTQLEELMNSVDRIKISIVMQTNLSNYPGSRVDAIDKFRRAVRSFQAQLYKNAELIIVADGCNRTQQIYSREFKSDPSIKFLFIDKNGANNMYEDTENGKYYRGFPRRAGAGIATGKTITYMDSDDMLLPEFTMTLMLTYNANPDKKWWINGSWYDNNEHTWEENDAMYATDHDNVKTFPEIGGEWATARMKPNQVNLAPWLFMHSADCTTKWRDTIGGSEDSDFNRRLRAEYKDGIAYNSPIYIRCHYRDIWDF
jgi:glycosyltransferase involved in cell wall biosynthesis